MKDGFINGALEDLLIEQVVFPWLLTVPFIGPLLQIPGVKKAAMWLIRHSDIQKIFDEGQRLWNFKQILDEETAKNERFKKEKEDLQRLQNDGKTLDDPEARKAYEDFKNRARELIRIKPK